MRALPSSRSSTPRLRPGRAAPLVLPLLLPLVLFSAAPAAGSQAFAQDPSAGGAAILPGEMPAAGPGTAERPMPASPMPASPTPATPTPAGPVQTVPSGPGPAAAAWTGPGVDGSAGPGPDMAGPATEQASAYTGPAADPGPVPVWVYDRPLPGDPAPGPPRRPRPQLSDAGDPPPLAGASGTGHADQALIEREQRRDRPVDPAKRAELVGLAHTLGALHALRVSCDGRGDQTWRSRMATLLDLEAPASGTLRDPLVVAFNGGFQAGGRGIATCPQDPRTREASLARQGRQLALQLAARYRPPVAGAAPDRRPGPTPGPDNRVVPPG